MSTKKLSCLFLALLVIAIGCKKRPTATTTQLHQAARAGNIEQVQLLISSGADVNAKDNNGMTSLHWVAVFGHENVV